MANICYITFVIVFYPAYVYLFENEMVEIKNVMLTVVFVLIENQKAEKVSHIAAMWAWLLSPSPLFWAREKFSPLENPVQLGSKGSTSLIHSKCMFFKTFYLPFRTLRNNSDTFIYYYRYVLNQQTAINKTTN